jgi:hypothetical protein
MSRPLFLRILQGLQQQDTYFTQRVDATGMPGLGPLQKVCAALRILAYGLPSDAVDEYIQIRESTARECFIIFVAQSYNILVSGIYGLLMKQT